jgi:hypothetical protein
MTVDHHEAMRFFELDQRSARLRNEFQCLTDAHGFFQSTDHLKSISVADAQPDGSIEAVFNGVRIKFHLLLTFGSDHALRGRVVCMHCHATYGEPVQAYLGDFSFDVDGVTDLQADANGRHPRLRDGGPAIILHFLEQAIRANSTI